MLSWSIFSLNCSRRRAISTKARFIRHSCGYSKRDGLSRTGARRRTTAKRSSTPSPSAALSSSPERLKTGSVFPALSAGCCDLRVRGKHHDLAPEDGGKGSRTTRQSSERPRVRQTQRCPPPPTEAGIPSPVSRLKENCAGYVDLTPRQTC